MSIKKVQKCWFFSKKKPFVVNNGFSKDKYLKTLSKILKVINIFDMVNVYLYTEE